jgi:hypothetical protein
MTRPYRFGDVVEWDRGAPAPARWFIVGGHRREYIAASFIVDSPSIRLGFVYDSPIGADETGENGEETLLTKEEPIDRR